MNRGVRWVAGVAAIAAGVLACQEQLTSPGQCPELCPGGTPVVHDTVLTAVPGGDESVPGYFDRGAGKALLVSNGLPASEDRALYRFAPRFDSIVVLDTARGYTVDSVLLALTVVARDTLVNGLKIYLYRLPADFFPTPRPSREPIPSWSTRRSSTAFPCPIPSTAARWRSCCGGRTPTGWRFR